MKYKRNQYTQGFSICALLIAGMFYYWGIDAFLNGFWQFGVNWMGFLWIGIGSAILASQVAALANRSKLKNVVLQEFEANPNISVEEISANTGISVKDIRAIVLDLKADGRLRGKFSSKTGEAKAMEVAPKVAEKTEVQDQGKFCPNCGTPVERETASFCAYCGSNL